MYTAILWAMVAIAAPALDIRPPKHCAIKASIEGFSANDTSVAVRERIACRHGRATDRFTLIELFDVASGEHRASFAIGGIQRFDGRGRRLFVAPRQIANANPAYSHARLDWSRWQARGHVAQHRYDFDETLVRFAFDGGIDGSVDVRGKTAILTGPSGRPLGASIVARLSDGRHIAVGHVQSSAREARSIAVDVHYSASGRSVAVVAHCGDSWHVEAHLLPDDAIIGTHKLGLSNRMFDFSRRVRHDFVGVHPEAKDDWNSYIHTGI